MRLQSLMLHMRCAVFFFWYAHWRCVHACVRACVRACARAVSCVDKHWNTRRSAEPGVLTMLRMYAAALAAVAFWCPAVGQPVSPITIGSASPVSVASSRSSAARTAATCIGAARVTEYPRERERERENGRAGGGCTRMRAHMHTRTHVRTHTCSRRSPRCRHWHAPRRLILDTLM